MTTQSATAPEVQAAPVATVLPTPTAAKPIGFAPLGNMPVVGVKPEGGNSVIRQYTGKSKGYIVLQQTTIDFSNPTWPKPKLRSTLMKGEVEFLKMLVNSMMDKKTLAFPGKLIVTEVLFDQQFQDELAEAIEATQNKTPIKKGKYAKQIADLNLTAEDDDTMLKDVLKRAGKDGPILTKHVDGEDLWILKFTSYAPQPDAAGNYPMDVLIAHDNHAEIAEYRAEHPQGGTSDDADDNAAGGDTEE